MAKLTGPLLSFGARGSVGKALVVSKWRGVVYARQHVVPANPQTAAQTAVRSLFAYLREMWKLAPTEVIDTWDSFAQGRPFTGMNKFVGENVRVLNGETDMNNFIGSPGSKGGLPPTAFSATTGGASGEIDFDFTVPAAPSGWTLLSSVAIAFPDANPTGIFVGPFVSEEVTSAPWDGTLTGLGSAVPCQVAGWLTWQKPNGDTAYSVSLLDQATSGA